MSKPKILRMNGQWVCATGMERLPTMIICDSPSGAGETPFEAYQDWRRQNRPLWIERLWDWATRGMTVYQ